MVAHQRLITVSLVAMLTLGVSGCGGSDQVSENIQQNSQSSTTNDLAVETGAELINIQSSNVRMASYDLESQQMTVMFKDGSLYWYQPVAPSVWTAFYNAQPHPWSRVGKPELVDKGIPYGRLN